MKYLIGCGGVFFLLFVAGLTWAVTLGGYSLDDPELEYQGAWTRSFKQDNPDLAREIGRRCKDEIGRSPWTRDGAMALFTCIRTKAEAQGYYYEWAAEHSEAIANAIVSYVEETANVGQRREAPTDVTD